MNAQTERLLIAGPAGAELGLGYRRHLLVSTAPDLLSAVPEAPAQRVSDDGKLYITLGQPHNVQPAGKVLTIEPTAGVPAAAGCGRQLCDHRCCERQFRWREKDLGLHRGLQF